MSIGEIEEMMSDFHTEMRYIGARITRSRNGTQNVETVNKK